MNPHTTALHQQGQPESRPPTSERTQSPHGENEKQLTGSNEAAEGGVKGEPTTSPTTARGRQHAHEAEQIRRSKSSGGITREKIDALAKPRSLSREREAEDARRHQHAAEIHNAALEAVRDRARHMNEDAEAGHARAQMRKEAIDFIEAGEVEHHKRQEEEHLRRFEDRH
ncbi:hypothetical protein HK102_012364 [Quaeritorhiza haematococci]|nr:hypothetical protein HK102_012364 [Quaeritorhiza haematococci]